MNTGGFSGGGHRNQNPLKVLKREPLLNNQADGEIERLSAGHSEVVDGAKDSDFSDIPPFKEQGFDDKGIGRKGQSLLAQGDPGAVMGKFLMRVLKERSDHGFNQLLHKPPTPAMRHDHPIIVTFWERAVG